MSRRGTCIVLSGGRSWICSPASGRRAPHRPRSPTPSGTPAMAIASSSSEADGTWTGSFDGLETPVPLVDLERLERNLDRMASYTTSHSLALRPHTKTHKSPMIGAEQISRGAVGLTCATPLELEVMAEVCNDLLLAYPPVGASK